MNPDQKPHPPVTDPQRATSIPILLLRAAVRLVFTFGIWGGLLFLSAGTFSWLRGWLHLALWLLTFAVNLAVLLPGNREVISARMNAKRSTERTDTFILVLFLFTTLAIPAIAGLDAVRWQSTTLPFWTVYVGLAIHAAGDALLLWTMAANPFLEKTVRVQSERGHRVITTGPYAIVRHPMYLGVVLMFLAIPLTLGSVWTFLPVVAMTVLLMVRSGVEERLLRRELPGYEAYMEKTRWRILPRIW